VFTLGWDPVATSDDFIARWVSPFPATHVAIDPEVSGLFGHDGITQIDAIKVPNVPEPSTLILLASGLAGLVAWRRRKRA